MPNAVIVCQSSALGSFARRDDRHGDFLPADSARTLKSRIVDGVLQMLIPIVFVVVVVADTHRQVVFRCSSSGGWSFAFIRQLPLPGHVSLCVTTHSSRLCLRPGNGRLPIAKPQP